MMKCKNILQICMVTAGLWITLTVAAFAEEKPEVVWPHSSVNAVSNREATLADATVLQAVSSAVNDKLHALETAGKLPFSLKESDDGFTEDITENAAVALIPLIMDDHCYKSEYIINGQPYYKAVVMTQIDVAFCYYPGSGNSLRVLHTIPLIGYSVIGTNGEFTAPISKAVLQEQFVNNASQLIQDNLEFKNKRFLDDIELKMVTPDTYQVTDVTISSAAAQRFYGPRIPVVKALIASAFTRQYAASHDDVTVLPSIVSGTWQEDAAKKTYQLSLGDTGKYIVMERANNEIVLDLQKIAAFDIPIEHDAGVYKKKGYTASVVNKTDNKTGTATIQETVLPAANPNQVRHDIAGILAEILTDAAKDAAKE